MKHTILMQLLTLTALAAFTTAGVLSVRLVKKEREYRKGQEQLESIYTIMESIDEEADEDTAASKTPESQRRLAQYRALSEENPDMVGWIHIGGTTIDYPVMHTPEDPEFYLDHGFDRSSSGCGMIFIDGGCRMDTSSPNLLIYGHHMRNGSMFAQIEKYDDPAFYSTHSYVRFDTLEETGTWQVIAAFKQTARQADEEFKRMLLAETEEEFELLMIYLETHRFYDTGVEAVWGERLITLTTCEYSQKDGRFFVVAKYCGRA